jgi:MoxR-like ATPase
MSLASIPRETIAARLAEVGYVADRDLATALWMMDYLKRPLLIEGEAGVGKTEIAKALALVHGALRVELPAPAHRHQGARGIRREPGNDRGAHLFRRLPS